jgi:membrane protease subunit HflC
MTIDEKPKSSWRQTLLWGALLAFGVFAAMTSLVLVDETELVIVERLGHIVAVYDRPEDRGLHFKWPWPIGTARRFDARVQLFDPPGREVFTGDKKNVTVETYVCWRIGRGGANHPVVTFFRALGSHDAAAARLESQLRSIVATRIGQLELSQLLRVENSEQGPTGNGDGLLAGLSRDIRDQLQMNGTTGEMLLDRLGLEIVDARIKRINFPLGNQQAVFERMKSERQKIADRYRSAGLAESTVIRSHADRQHAELLAKADADAERIRGEAEAEATAILNQAHAADPEFYRTLRTLDAYRTILNDKTTLVLSASSSLFKMLTEGVPASSVVPTPSNVESPPRAAKSESLPSIEPSPTQPLTPNR